MLRIRLKMSPSSGTKEWKCCFGLHVRTVTIIIGVWHLFLNILSLGILAVIIRTNNRLLLDEYESKHNDYASEQEAPALPTPLSKIESQYSYRDHSLNAHDVDMSGVVYLCMIAITLMLIYGAVKGKPSHLLPFFCLQIFDFAITTLTAAGYLCYLRSIHNLINESRRLPWREELLKLSPQALNLIAFVAFLSFVFLKAYVIKIVWNCYKFLSLRQHDMRTMLPYIIPDVNNVIQERDLNSLLPDYDEATAQATKQAPPPSYEVAMLAVFTESNVNTEVPENHGSMHFTSNQLQTNAEVNENVSRPDNNVDV